MRCEYITWEGIHIPCRNKLDAELILQKRNAKSPVKGHLIKVGKFAQAYAERIKLTLDDKLFLGRDL